MLTVFTAGPLGAQPKPDDVIRGVSYVGVSVSDIEASSNAYSAAAGLELVESKRIKGPMLDAIAGRVGAVADARLMKSTNAQLRLMAFPDAPQAAPSTRAVPVNGTGVAHVCYQADGTNQVYQQFLAAGATPIGEKEMVSLNPRNPVLYAYAHDRDGIMFEVEHIDLSAMGDSGPPKGFHRIRHVSIATPNIDRAVEFYSILLDNPSPRRAGGADGLSGEQFDKVSGLPGTRIKMAWFQARNLEVELIQYLSHPPAVPTQPRPLEAPGYNMVVFDTGNLEAIRKRLLAAGGTVLAGPFTTDEGEILFGRDLDHNLLGFLVTPDTSLVSSQGFKTQ